MFSYSKGLVSLFIAAMLSPAASADLTLDKALNLANANDPWLQNSELLEKAIQQNTLAIDRMPDPVMSMTMSNLPVDGFDLNQEAMTQLKVGVAQKFPRGETIQAKQRHLQLSASEQPHKRAQRKAQNRQQISQLWLDSQGKAKKIAILNQYKQLFSQLSAIVETSYAVAQSHTRQQDVLRSQLEVARIEDKIEAFEIQSQASFHQILAWFPQEQQLQYLDNKYWQSLIEGEYPPLPAIPSVSSGAPLIDTLSQHPEIKGMESKIQAGFSLVDVAQQQFEPQWGINASYGLRDNQPNGQSRADLFSIGISVDLPLFSKKQNKAAVKSARLTAQAKETERRLLLQRMLSEVNRLSRQFSSQKDRLQDYQAIILTPMQQQSEASLTAYTNGEGDFSEVMRSRLAELSAELEHIDLHIALLSTQAKLNYYLNPFAVTSLTARTMAQQGGLQ